MHMKILFKVIKKEGGGFTETRKGNAVQRDL